jgi:hypothetical protein
MVAELRHDATQRDRERQMTLRREVYLPAAESASRLQGILGQLVDLTVSNQILARESLDHVTTMARITVVGSDKTVKAVYSLLSEFNSAFADLSLRRIALTTRQRRLDEVAQALQMTSAEQNRWLDILRGLDPNQRTDPSFWNVVKENLDRLLRQHEEYSTEHEALLTSQLPDRLEFADACLTRALNVAERIPSAVFAVRQELELPLDEEGFLRIHSEGLDKTKAIFRDFVATIRSEARGQE